jgi:hypothetical protein
MVLPRTQPVRLPGVDVLLLEKNTSNLSVEPFILSPRPHNDNTMVRVGWNYLESRNDPLLSW